MTDDLPPLPGLDVVGRGLFLRPHQPYELKRQLFAQESPRRYYSREADSSYALPQGYEVDESPPPPAGVALNKVRIEESWERFSKTRAIDFRVHGKTKGLMAFLRAQKGVGGVKRYRSGFYHIDNGPRRTW